MKIGILSDIHENFHNLILALKELEKSGVDRIICLGDLMNDGVAKIFSISKIPVFVIWGNNDGDRVAITKTAFREGSNLSVSNNTYDFVTIDDCKIFLTHYDDLAEPMAVSGVYDAVFFGHTHLKQVEKYGNCLLVNPGEISAYKTGIASFALYDTEKKSVDIIEVAGSITLKTDLVNQYLKENEEKLALRSKFKH